MPGQPEQNLIRGLFLETSDLGLLCLPTPFKRTRCMW